MRCVFNRFALYLMRFMAYLIFVNAVGMSHVFNHWVDSHWVAIGNLPYISSINNAEDNAYFLVLILVSSVLAIPAVLISEFLLRKLIALKFQRQER